MRKIFLQGMLGIIIGIFLGVYLYDYIFPKELPTTVNFNNLPTSTYIYYDKDSIYELYRDSVGDYKIKVTEVKSK